MEIVFWLVLHFALDFIRVDDPLALVWFILIVTLLTLVF